MHTKDDTNDTKLHIVHVYISRYKIRVQTKTWFTVTISIEKKKMVYNRV